MYIYVGNKPHISPHLLYVPRSVCLKHYVRVSTRAHNDDPLCRNPDRYSSASGIEEDCTYGNHNVVMHDGQDKRPLYKAQTCPCMYMCSGSTVTEKSKSVCRALK